MAEEYVLPKPETLSVDPKDADKLIASGSGDAALLYLYILRRNGRLDTDRVRSELGLGDRLDTALSVLQRLGLVRMPGGTSALRTAAPEKLPPGSSPELPVYTVAEVQRAAGANPGFRVLLDEAAQRLGRLLSANDMLVLFGIYDYLGMPPEVILLVINWCIQELERKFGPGKRPTLRQIEKEAYIWQDRGILTLEQAEKHTQALLERSQGVRVLCRVLGIRNRDLSPTEDRYVRSWLDMGFTLQAVEEAYDRTILKKKELAWPYMNRILENWHKKGLHDLPQVLEQDPRERKTPRKQEPGVQPEAPSAEEYRRMQRLVEKMNGGGGNGA